MPAWPTWATAMNIYLTAGAPGSETFYMSIPRSELGTTYPVGRWIPLAAPIPPAGRTPPSTNLAAANTPVIPTVVTYEGGATTCVPDGIPFQYQLLHDTFAHPSFRDVVWGWYAACQLGDQSMAGSGATLANYYQLYNSIAYASLWVLAYGSSQPAGDG